MKFRWPRVARGVSAGPGLVVPSVVEAFAGLDTPSSVAIRPASVSESGSAADTSSAATNTTNLSLLADWLYRSGMGAVSGGWGQLFTQAADVNNYRFSTSVNGGPGGWDVAPNPGTPGSFVRLAPGLGIMGNGCLEMEQLTNGNLNSYWQRPFNPNIAHWQTDGSGGEHGPGQEFYIQLAFRTNCEGQAGTGGEGRKHWSVSLMRSSYTFQELVVYDDNYRGVLQMYQGKGPTNQYDPLVSAVPPSDFNLQPGSQYTQGVGGGYCSYQAIGGSNDRSNCWIPGDSWAWYLFHVIPGTQMGSNAYLSIDAWVSGMTNYVRIFERTNQYMEYETDAQFFDSVLFWIYETNRTGGPANQKQWYDQPIFSNQWIPPPAAGTTLGQTVAGMASNSWAQLSTTNMVTSPITATSGMWLMLGSAGIGGIGADSNRMAWDPLHQRVHFIGQYHGGANGLRHVYLDLKTNTWTTVTHFGDLGDTSGHGLDSICCDPNTGDIYFARYNNTAVAKFTFATQTWNLNWSNMPSKPNLGPEIFFWTGALSGVTGGKGAICAWAMDVGDLNVYDVGLGTWTLYQHAFGGDAPGYDGVAAYNRRGNVALMGAANNPGIFPRRFDSSRGLTTLGNLPSPLALSIRDGTLCEHPTKPNSFLTMTVDGRLFELTSAGVYTNLGNLPAGVNPPRGGADNVLFSTVVALPEYGVMMAVSTTVSGARCDLYKP